MTLLRHKYQPMFRHDWQPWKDFARPIYCTCGAEKKRSKGQFIYRMGKSTAWTSSCPPCTKKQHRWRLNTCQQCGAQERFDLERPVYRTGEAEAWTSTCPPCTAERCEELHAKIAQRVQR